MSSVAWLLLGLLAVALATWLAVHWRYHIRATPLDSAAGVRARLGQGRPVLVQFHAPL